jgi:hypothetical protein
VDKKAVSEKGYELITEKAKKFIEVVQTTKIDK